jgi:hypothetical protein
MNTFTYEIIETELGPTKITILRRLDSEGQVTFIPVESGNSDYAEYLASLEATEPEAE